MPKNAVVTTSQSVSVETEQPTTSQSVPASQPAPLTPAQQYNAWWHAPFAGVVAGISGGTLNYPFEGAKKRAQSGQLQPWQMPGIRPHTFVRELYRGGSSFILSLAPVSMLQATFNDYLKGFLPNNPSQAYVVGAGVLSGAVGAFFSAPVEHMIITQQQQKIGPLQAMKYLYSRGPTYAWTALPPLMIREAGFGCAWLMGAHAAGEALSAHYNRDLRIPAAIGVGVLAAGLTHPFDSMATRKQQSKERITMIEAGRQILAQKGWKGFFAGYQYRSFLFTGCMVSIAFVDKAARETLSNGSTFAFFKPASKATPRATVEEVKQNDADNSPRIGTR